MNGVHDMGGMHGMGAIDREVDEPIFHAPWERRAFALTLAGGAFGLWNLDVSRHARERMPAAEYLAATYYERWLWGLERLLERFGLVARGEVDGRMAAMSAAEASPAPAERPAAAGSAPAVRVLRADDVLVVLRSPGGARLADDVPARFRPGQAVRARMMNPEGHTRLPRYVRGRVGTIEVDHGVWILPDAHAHGAGKAPQHLYGVRFAARELWGEAAPARDAVFLDLWDDYLEPA